MKVSRKHKIRNLRVNLQLQLTRNDFLEDANKELTDELDTYKFMVKTLQIQLKNEQKTYLSKNE